MIIENLEDDFVKIFSLGAQIKENEFHDSEQAKENFNLLYQSWATV